MRILFWGTPEFALPSLGALLGEGHDVVGVVTQPDRPRGRGRRSTPSPVKALARDEGLEVLQPEDARDREFVDRVRSIAPDMNVAVAYGQILGRELLDAPARGSLNVHASLLPELRGAAPINWAIIRGHERTGVTIMRMVEELDAGPILFQIEEPIAAGETATDLTIRLSEIGAAALVEALAIMEFDEIDEREQDHALATYAPRLDRDDAHVDWARSGEEVERLIRGMDAAPGAWTLLNGVELKVYRPKVAPEEAVASAPGGAGPSPDGRPEPGTVVSADATDPQEALLVACGQGGVWIREVKPAGRRRMTAAEWLRGRGASAGDRLG